MKINSNLDKMAIELLINAPLMDKSEMHETIIQLKKMAAKKSGKRKVKLVMDFWADKAYKITMESA
ncbi:conserved hypothetical protein [Methanococcus vannielii SB]|uniref:Uncharacterized protein n=1 Tax=Methanococcus vannielii (strain ATCC 35089 / DSM 1224 / JCM 13029 / OCM 148 / SB) TaxID=406327 RepID=A6USC6_METVS|nr:hypothetical protein [Methanococcus vannielii]ABR55398.1 conserved hypothetical protein [Methanococcus vannielii SB]